MDLEAVAVPNLLSALALVLSQNMSHLVMCWRQQNMANVRRHALHLAQQIVDVLEQLVITLDCNMLCWPSDSNHEHPLPALRQYIILSMQLVGLRAIPGILQEDKRLIQIAVILTTLLNIINSMMNQSGRADKEAGEWHGTC